MRKKNSVIAAEIESGIREVEGLFAIVADASEVSDDALPRITACPLCGGTVAFAPLSMLDIPRVDFTPDTTWGDCRSEWMEYVRQHYEQEAIDEGEELSDIQRAYVKGVSTPYALMLECQRCGKGFDPCWRT